MKTLELVDMFTRQGHNIQAVQQSRNHIGLVYQGPVSPSKIVRLVLRCR